MRILVTGAGGFVGRHLVRELQKHGNEIVAFDLAYPLPLGAGVRVYTGDLRRSDDVNRVVAAEMPDACIHLGGVAFVPEGKFHPEAVLAINIMGTVNVLEAFREYAPLAKILVISSAQIYATRTDEHRIRETDPIEPVGIYAISKAAADLATLAYSRKYGMHTMTARPNNHTGPGQAPQFVVPSFVRQVKAIAQGKQRSEIRVGNLESERLFLDVRDVVRAYRLLIEKGEPGQAYNISSDRMIKIRTILDMLCELTGIKPEIVVDPERLRPTDRSPLLDTERLEKTTGWCPEIPLSRTLRDMLSES